MAREPSSAPPTKFGLFYPRGYVVVAFEDAGEAESARELLIMGGYDPQDVFLSDATTVLEHTKAHLGSANPLAKALGPEYAAESRHQELAEKGHTFLLAYAPSELDTERLMNVVRRFRFGLAQKYDRFTLQELRPR
jgi:hypothetical protein